MTTRPRVYLASSSKFHKEVISIYHDYPAIQWTNRWQWMIECKVPESDAERFCIHDLDDIYDSDFLICWQPPSLSLRGAMFEAGVAYGLHKHVLVAGDVDFTWHKSPRIKHFLTLERCIDEVRRLHGEAQDQQIRMIPRRPR